MSPCSGSQKLMMLEAFLGPFGFHVFVVVAIFEIKKIVV